MDPQAEWRYLKQGRYSISDSQVLGEGSFGKVFKGYDYTTQKWVAMKQIALDKLTSSYGEQFKEIILGQISIMRKFGKQMQEKPCQFLVKQEDCFRTEKYIYIVMEICDQGTLEEEMRSKRLTQTECIEILYCLASGLAYMADMNIVHRDLKPQNVFVTNGMVEGFEEKVYKIGDFGFASQKQEHDIAMGTIPYMAPEMLIKGKYTSKVDIWSLGVIAHQIIFRKLYFGGADRWEIQKNIKQKPFVLSEEDKLKISKEYQDFLDKCLKKDPNQRIKASNLLSHQIFRGVRESIDLMKLQASYEKELRKTGSYEKNKAQLSSSHEQSSNSETPITGESKSSQNYEQAKRQEETKKQINVFDGLQALIFECVKMRQMAQEFYYLSEQKRRQTEFMQIYLLKDAYVMMNKITYTVFHKQDYTGVLNYEQIQSLNSPENEQLVKVLSEHCSRECQHVAGLFNEKYRWMKTQYIQKFEEEDQELINIVVNEEPYEYINEQVFQKQLNKWVEALAEYKETPKWKQLWEECLNMAALKNSTG